MSKRSQYLQVTFKGLKNKNCVYAYRQEDKVNEAKCKQLMNLQKPSKGLKKVTL